MVLNSGNCIIYNVDSTDYSVKQPNHFSYMLKELVAGTYKDQTGKTCYRIERYVRKDSMAGWSLKDVWSAYIDGDEYQRVEENITYVRMVFPLKSDDYFNANKYNNLGSELSFVRSLHCPFRLGKVIFDSTVTIIHKADTTNLVKNRLVKSVYAWNTGLVYFYEDSLTLSFDPGRKGDTIGGYSLKYIFDSKNF